MKSIKVLIVCVCIAAGFTACGGKKASSGADSGKTNLTKDSVGTLSDSTMGKVPDSSNKTPAPAATGAKGHVDSVTKK